MVKKKIEKYERHCRHHNWHNMPFVVESYGALSNEALKLLEQLSATATNPSEWLNFTHHVLSCALQRGNTLLIKSALQQIRSHSSSVEIKASLPSRPQKPAPAISASASATSNSHLHLPDSYTNDGYRIPSDHKRSTCVAFTTIDGKREAGLRIRFEQVPTQIKRIPYAAEYKEDIHESDSHVSDNHQPIIDLTTSNITDTLSTSESDNSPTSSTPINLISDSESINNNNTSTPVDNLATNNINTDTSSNSNIITTTISNVINSSQSDDSEVLGDTLSDSDNINTL